MKIFSILLCLIIGGGLANATVQTKPDPADKPTGIYNFSETVHGTDRETDSDDTEPVSTDDITYCHRLTEGWESSYNHDWADGGKASVTRNLNRHSVDEENPCDSGCDGHPTDYTSDIFYDHADWPGQTGLHYLRSTYSKYYGDSCDDMNDFENGGYTNNFGENLFPICPQHCVVKDNVNTSSSLTVDGYSIGVTDESGHTNSSPDLIGHQRVGLVL